MAAILVWGRDFRVTDTTLPTGEVSQSYEGVDGGQESITWSSIDEMQRLAERHGVSKNIWPLYPDSYMEIDVPIEDAQKRSSELRLALDRLDPSVFEENYWLNFVYGILSDGNCFYVIR